ncbi:MAG: tryptophan 2,3-dioxygenase [Myxococcales bacterium]|nr:tryptophan 2,3-dioxygenase [Myxococcales bacterium]
MSEKPDEQNDNSGATEPDKGVIGEVPVESLYGDESAAPRAIRTSDLTYNDYLRVGKLLELQVPESNPAHHDEMLFIIIHQAYELWFKLILHELERAMAFMNEGKHLRARHFINRVVEIMRLLVQQIHIVETMQPIDFLHFRDHLMPASGFQSVQFREVEFAAGLKDERYCTFFDNRPDLRARLEARLAADDMRTVWCRMINAAGFAMPEAALDPATRDQPEVREAAAAALIPVFQRPDDYMPLYLLCESLIAFDEYLSLWREHHVRVVARVIGWRPGTGGSSGVDYLKSTASKRAFPELWEVRTALRRDGESGGLSGPSGGGCPMGY